MPRDGQTIPTTVILPDLLALTGAAVAPAEALLATATERLRAELSVDGRVSGKLLEENQTAAHGLAWLATYVESLRQMHAWAERLNGEGKFGEVEQLILQIASANTSGRSTAASR
jgi:(2S)-methylsuccinyl-CoA dehydrogenase